MSRDTGRRRGGRQREHRHAGEPLSHRREATVRRPEVVSPLTDAVRLVDGDETDAGGRQAAEQAALQSLRRGVHEFAASLGQQRQMLMPLGRGERRVHQHRGEPSASQPLDLVRHERDQRRHDEDHAAEDARGNLERHGLARAGRQHADGVASGQHGIYELQLARTEPLVAEDLSQHGAAPLAALGRGRLEHPHPPRHGDRAPRVFRRSCRDLTGAGRGR